MDGEKESSDPNSDPDPNLSVVRFVSGGATFSGVFPGVGVGVDEG